jgi:hypothetical protein
MALQLQSSELAPLVAQVLGKQMVEILSWRCEPLASGGSNYVGGTGLYRVTGTAQDQEGNYDWSMWATEVTPHLLPCLFRSIPTTIRFRDHTRQGGV